MGKQNAGRKILINKIVGEKVTDLIELDSDQISEYGNENCNYNFFTHLLIKKT